MEIERKWLVNIFQALDMIQGIVPLKITQGYLNTMEDEYLIRYRSVNNLAFMMELKSKGHLSRQELGYLITKEQFEEGMKLCKTKVSKKATAKYRLEKGTTEFMQKKFIRFRFALWRYKLTDIQRIDLLFKRLEKKYKVVKDQGKKFPTQRIGITFAAQEKEYNIFTNSKTNRKNTTEVYDFISTATFANNDPSTVGMFEELKDKVIKYYLKTGKSPSMLDEASVKAAKHFYVFFVEA